MFDTKKLTSSKTLIMGILNLTPDSFSDGGEYFNNTKKAVARIEEMLSEGADIIDIGGESTRPGSSSVTEEEESKRVIPIIKEARKKLGNNFTISIDTNKPRVAKEALESGADIVNSLGGFSFDKNLAKIVASYKCPVIIYHIKGVPKTMQKGEIKYKDVVADIKKFFEKQINIGKRDNIKKSQFIIDPGIGFGKTVEQNIDIIKRLSEFKKLNLPILVGVSRKSYLGFILQKGLNLENTPEPKERLEAALAQTALAVVNGAKIIRTHDVLKTKTFLTLLTASC